MKNNETKENKRRKKILAIFLGVALTVSGFFAAHRFSKNIEKPIEDNRDNVTQEYDDNQLEQNEQINQEEQTDQNEQVVEKDQGKVEKVKPNKQGNKSSQKEIVGTIENVKDLVEDNVLDKDDKDNGNKKPSIPNKPPIADNPSHTHKYGSIEKYDSNYEYRYCKDDGHELKTAHKLSTTSYYDPQTKMDVYKCLNDGCNYKLSKNHVHKYGAISHSDAEYEYRYCQEDNQEKKTKHNFSSTPTYNKATNMEVYECLNDGCNYKLQKQHKNHEYVRTNDRTYEIDTCKICGNQIKNQHIFDIGTPIEDGVIEYKCENDGCDYSYRIEQQHEHHLTTTYIKENRKDLCRTAVTSCSICGQEISRTPIYEHETQEVTTGYLKQENACKKVVDRCKNCDYQSEERIITNHRWSEPVVDEFGSTKYCLDCNYESIELLMLNIKNALLQQVTEKPKGISRVRK